MNDKLKQRLIAAAFCVACFALGVGVVTFPEWATFALQLIGLA